MSHLGSYSRTLFRNLYETQEGNDLIREFSENHLITLKPADLVWGYTRSLFDRKFTTSTKICFRSFMPSAWNRLSFTNMTNVTLGTAMSLPGWRWDVWGREGWDTHLWLCLSLVFLPTLPEEIELNKFYCLALPTYELLTQCYRNQTFSINFVNKSGQN